MATVNRKTLAATAAGLALLAGAGVASATIELQIDVNALTAAASGPGFDENFTGSVDLSDNGNSALAGILIDGVQQAFAGTLNDFTGTINLNNGDVTGGSFTVAVLESDNVTINTYSATISSGAGDVNSQAGQGFNIDGLTFQGMFSSSTFAGVDVSAWFDAQPLTGSFLQFAFNPNMQGVDTQSDIDIFVTVPLPAGGAMAFVGLAGLASVRRRSC